ncbi:MAG: hypothetical protein CMO55_26560 [Verrucomicrobiales bacterium]|nr:hypothetical protein [Verrucomicrobiales bacterium]
MSNVALLFPYLEYSNEIVEGIIGELEENAPFTPLRIQFHPDHAPLVPDDIQGIIGLTSQNLSWLPPLLKRDIPYINCGTDLLEVENVLSVYVDQNIASSAALEHFKKAGLRRVYFACYQMENRFGIIRKALFFQESARESGLKTGLLEIKGEDPHSNPKYLLDGHPTKAVEKLLKDLPRPSGIFCEDDLAALMIQNAAISLGLRVPTDIAILGYGNQLIGRFGKHSISTFPTGGERVGRIATHLMHEWLSTGSQPKAPAPLAPMSVIVRDSTGGTARSLDLERVRRRIEKEACRGLVIDELCTMAGVSRKTLISRYRDAFGETPSEAIRRLRFDRARQLLLEPDPHRLANIASECGFSSLTSFTNFFTRQAGVPPREYQKTIRKETA